MTLSDLSIPAFEPGSALPRLGHRQLHGRLGPIFGEIHEARGAVEIVNDGQRDARVAMLRRDAYFRYRWPLTLQAVATLERDRIVGDSAFAGPRPDWAR